MTNNPDLELEAVKQAVKMFMSATKCHRAAFDKYAQNVGMHRSQHRMLMYLCRQGGKKSQKDIAEAMDVSPAAITVMLNKLESAGYIYRTVSEMDSRVNLISPTEKGLSLCEDTRRYFYSIDKAMFKGFSDEEIEQLTAQFERMKNNLKEFK